MMLASNWDAKDARDGEGSNTGVYSMSGSNELFYAFADWGSTMGKWGGFFGRDRWDPEGYRAQTRDFVRRGPGGAIEWGYTGKHSKDITSGISTDDIRWLLTYLSRVTDDELRAGLRASGARDPEIASYSLSIRARIAQLENLSPADRRRITASGGLKLATPLFAWTSP
jgi:hypothetical protein